MDRGQFDPGAPASEAPADARVCVVATRQATFRRCRDGVYPSPASYSRTDESFEYIAFYRTAPVSAITHYAPVTDRTEQHRDGAGPMAARDWERLIEPFSEEQTVVVFELADLVALDRPVENDRNGVRGAWYCTVGDLRAATALSELAARARA